MNTKPPEKESKRLYYARYREIIKTIAEYGFTDIAHKFFPWYPFGYRNTQKQSVPGNASRNERIRLLLERLGPTFIKLGQLLSGRPDIVDADLARELEKLQDSVPPFPGEKAAAVVREELGKPVSELFLSFDPVPLASASVAQVHRATLHNGTEAAVKILRPDIERTVSLDIRILKNLAKFAQKHIRILSHFQPVALINTFGEALAKELDFTNELLNLERFTNTFGKEKHLRIPRFYRHISSRRVFVMEYIEGTKISAMWTEGRATVAAAYGCDPEVLADRFVTIILHQIFGAGFFHGDPHPGNVMALPDNVICFLDFGVMGAITSQQREYFINMLTSIPSRNMKRFTRSLLALVGIEQSNRFQELMHKCTLILDTYMSGTLADIRLTDMIQDILTLIVSFNMTLPPNITLMAKSLMSIESIALNLNPRFNILEKLTPLIKRITIEELSMKKAAGKTLSAALAYAELIRDFPETGRDIAAALTSGKFGVLLHSREIEHLSESVGRGSERMVFGLALAALILGSAMLLSARTPPLWKDISVFGLCGVLLAGALSLFAVIALVVRRLTRK